MPFFDLLIKFTDVSNVTSVTPTSGRVWHIKVKCGSCGEVSDKFSVLNPAEQQEVPGSRGTANLIQKCKFCGKTGSLSKVEAKEPEVYTEMEEWSRIATFEGRGLEPAEFQFMDGWDVQCKETLFENQDMELDGGWAEFDEPAECCAAIVDKESKFAVTEDRK